jgi:hypothetical protein
MDSYAIFKLILQRCPLMQMPLAFQALAHLLGENNWA